MMNTHESLPADEAEAMEYMKGIKEFWNHALMYAFFTVMFCGIFGMVFGFANPRILFMCLGFLGWGVGVFVHGLKAYEIIGFFGPEWERKLIEKRLKRMR